MEPAQLLPHLARGLQLALGEFTPRQRLPGGLTGFLRRILFIYCLPWPRGRLPAPRGAFDGTSAGWEADRRRVAELIERFASADPATLGPSHPAFGAMSPRDWDVLQYRHLDHHLRQFGA